MGFGSIKYDVEEKGLDPKVAHKELDTNGMLARPKDQEDALDVENKLHTPLKEDKAPVQPPESATSPEEAAALVQSMFEDETPEAIAAEEARLAELDKMTLEEAEKNAETKLVDADKEEEVKTVAALDEDVVQPVKTETAPKKSTVAKKKTTTKKKTTKK